MSPLFDDSDDDVSLPHRGDAHGTQVRSARELDRTPADREYTLNTGIVLALFFALALLCAVFFGFGYSIGHKSTPPAAAISGDSAPVLAPVTSSNKPSPGTVAVPEYVPSAGSPVSHPAPATATAPPREAASIEATAVKPAPVVRIPPPAVIAPPATAVATTAPTGGTTYVQVAAVSHQEDADVLLSSLRRRGYTVLTRADANDRLIHVQIGPFPTRKDAETMRQKLLADGYNGILK
jgi:DedD protein